MRQGLSKPADLLVHPRGAQEPAGLDKVHIIALVVQHVNTRAPTAAILNSGVMVEWRGGEPIDDEMRRYDGGCLDTSVSVV